MLSSSPTIQKLPEEVINRIAAGEVVQRPSAALKELVENSLDAGSTDIAVSAVEGGLDILQVADDGSGVRYDDLSLLCERYATSKLRSFEDLASICSFGFRGEALASVSYVSRVTVTTKRRCSEEASRGDGVNDYGNDGRVAWRCRYMDGKLVEKPQPCAGNYGTIIRSEKMFYNTQVRRAALKPSEEWRRVLDVVSRYALAFPHVGFSCQKEKPSAGSSDGLVFPKNSTTLDNLRLLLGNKVASHLRFIYFYNVEVPEESAVDRASEEEPRLVGSERLGQSHSSLVNEPEGKCEGRIKEETSPEPLPQRCRAVDSDIHGLQCSPPFTSSAQSLEKDRTIRPARGAQGQVQRDIMGHVSAAAKATQRLCGGAGEGKYAVVGYTSDATLLYRKPFLTLFVNNRLVESSTIRRAIDAVYSSVLTGGNKPVVVLFLTVPADRLDVNVHPTKKEVRFLDEELVVGRLTELIRAALVEAAAEHQVDVTSLGKSTTLALQAAVRYQATAATITAGGADGMRENGRPDALTQSSAAKGVLSFQQRSVSGSLVGVGRNPAVVVAPCTMVRVEPQRGALDAFLRPIKVAQQTGATSDVAAAMENESATATHQISKGEVMREVAVETPLVDWTAVLASVKPVMDTEREPSTENFATEETTEGHSKVGEEGLTYRNLASSPRAVGQLPALLMRKPPADSESGGDDDDLADAMREFKRFKEESKKAGVQLSQQQSIPSEKQQLSFPPSSAPIGAVLDDEEGSNSVQVVGASGAVAAVPGTANEFSAGGSMVAATQLEDHVLSSVIGIIDSFASQTNATVQSFFDSLSFVGVCDDRLFLAQSGTSLLALDTLRLIREVVFQRIFLRWAQPSLPKAPLVTLVRAPQSDPQERERWQQHPHNVSVHDALLFALYHDWAGMANSLNSSSPLMKLLSDALKKARSGADDITPGGVKARQHMHGAGAVVNNVKQESATSTDNSTELSPLETKLLSRIPVLLFDRSSGPSASLATPAPTAGCHKYVRGLVRRLGRWRDMLEDYFSIQITSEGYLTALPCGLNTAWPPSVRAIPIFLWLLAETVPFPDSKGVHKVEQENDAFKDHHLLSDCEAQVEAERRCFERVARLIADTLYGMSASHLRTRPDDGCSDDGSPDITDETGGAVREEKGDEQRLSVKCERPTERGGEGASQKQERLAQRASLRKAIQFGLMPCLKNRKLFLPAADVLSDGTVQSVVTVESLYKVFERC